MSKPLSKIKHQIKSGKYYIFWGAATLAVMAGQIYVGAGYRGMSQSVQDLTEMIEIRIELEEIEKGRYPNGIMPIIQ
tara:strand:- start:3568 stop:3798 length:231 start_codon:yes stop_codon:yes gene_type:complete